MPKRLIPTTDRERIRFDNLVEAIDKANIHLDVKCYHYQIESFPIHTLTNECNPMEITNVYITLPTSATIQQPEDNPIDDLLNIVDEVVDTSKKGG